MKIQVFKKAKRLSEPICIGITPCMEFWEFKFKEGNLGMRIVQDHKGTEIKCTCKHCSVHEKYLCQYKIKLIEARIKGVRMIP